MLLGGVAQLVEHDTGLDARAVRERIEVDDAVQVFRAIHDDRDVAALPGETRAATAWQHGYVMAPARRDGRDDVVDGARDDHPDRHLTVVRRVGGIERAAPRIEAHFPFDAATKLGG